MSFLPPAPHGSALDGVIGEPPAVQPNHYINDAPRIFLEPRTAPRPTASDLLILKAREHYQQGKKFYQVKDAEAARREFDQAIDLMFEAAANPSDRERFDFRLDEMVDAIHRYDMAGLGSASNLEEPQFEKAPLEDILQMTFPVDPRSKNKVREQVSATVSQLPLVVNDSVLGYIHYFTGRGHSTMVTGLQRAGRFRSLIQRILDEEGIPQELIHLAQAESGFLPRAVSHKAATGMWQFVQFRGREYGLQQDRYADDRLDPEKATRAAARHLHDLYNKFGDWYLAIAAYNCGPGVIERAVERTGYADFWELRARRVLPLETTNYVPIILAMTIMTKNANEYGLDGITTQSPLEYDTVEITSPTHLALISDLTDAPVSELLALNPALLRGLAPAGYTLHVPKGTADYLMAALQGVPAGHRAAWRMHKVEIGETLAAIGKRYRINASSIAAVNQLKSDGPVAGDRLVIPASYRATDSPVRPAARATRHHRASSSKTLSKTYSKARSSRRVATRSGVKRAASFKQAGKLARNSALR